MKVGEPISIASRIEQAFQSASTTTGTSFEYLVKTAKRESNFVETARARTSSATGLFQFIESTWLETLKESGARHGLGQYADQIERTANGKYRVADPAMREKILNLRNDANIASMMAGELTQKNASYLTEKLGRPPSEGELYIAHFLGAGGAHKLISLAQSQPDLAADQVFSRQAKANKPIFYDRGGARSVSQVYANLVSKHSGPMPALPGAGGTLVAARPETKPTTGTELAYNADGERSASDAPTSRVLTAWSATDDISSPFHALFRNGMEARRVSFDSRFASAFAAQEAGQAEALERAAARLEAASSSDAYAERRSRVLVEASGGQRTASLVRSQPMDLTGFLNYQPTFAQRELLPPV